MTKKRNPLPSRAQLPLDFSTILFYTGTQADYPPRHFTTFLLRSSPRNTKPAGRRVAARARYQRVLKGGTLTMNDYTCFSSADKCINPRMGLSDNFDGLFAFTGGM